MILDRRLLAYGSFEHLEGVEGTPDEGTGGNGFETHFFPYPLEFFEFIRWDKSLDRVTVRTRLKVLADR
jgi:hypothetical protein